MADYTSAYPLLVELRDLLGAVDGIVTAKIGLEANITDDDYPIVRVVPSTSNPSRLAPIMGLRSHQVLVYFGKPVHEAQVGTEEVWREALELEAALMNALPREGDWVARWISTDTDEDRLPGYKVMVMTVQVDG